MHPCEECGQTRQGTPYRVRLYLTGPVPVPGSNAVTYTGQVYLCALCAGAPGDSTAND